MDISKDTKLLQWFVNSDLSDATCRLYSMYMRYFCDCVGRTPTELIADAIKEIKEGKLPSERKESEYFAKYKVRLKERNLSPKSQSVAITCVRSFYKAYDIQLSANITKIKKPLPMRENMNFLTKVDIIKLITNCHSLRDKAIILCMSTSGLARQEIINLRMQDITFDDSDIGTVSIRRQKSQVDYTTFIAPEAAQALKNYWEERSRTDKLKPKGQNDFVFVTYDNGTRIDKTTFGKLFRTLASQLGYQNGEYQIKSRSHALRKFFASTLENAGLPKNKIDHMLGHAPNSSDLAYFHYDVNKLKELYKTYLPHLSFERIIEVRSLNTEDARRLAELEKENELLKTGLRTKDGDITELRTRLDRFEAALQAVISPESKKK
jgi:site-specific recombinase XerD